METISNDEINLYDRQIRLLSLDGQVRLSHARVLVLGLGGLAVEVVKNLVLAGVGHVTLQDSEKVAKSDLETNFFLREEDVGALRAEAMQPRVQALNSRSRIDVSVEPPSCCTDNKLQAYDVVIATAILSGREIFRIDGAMHSANKAFYLGGLAGWAGYVFADLATHTYTTESKPADAEWRTIANVGNNFEVCDKYPSLEEAVQRCALFGKSLKPRRRAQISPYLPAFVALWDGPPDALTHEQIVERASQLGLLPTVVTPEFSTKFARCIGLELGAVATVVGGLLAQDVTSYLTRRREPIYNMVIYDGESGGAPIYSL